MKKAAAARVATDDSLLAFMRLFVGHLSSHGMTDRVAKTTVRYDPQRLGDFLDIDQVGKRVDSLLASKRLGDEDRAMLEAFVKGKKARAQGKDPRWMGPDEDE
jgi:hypothetical protein